MKIKVFLLLLLLLIISGCTNKNAKYVPIQNNVSSAQIKKGEYRTFSKETILNETEGNTNGIDREFEEDNRTSSERADKISKVVSEIETVESATVVITGKTAIIGIEIKGEITDKKLIQLKKDIEELVKLTDKNIKVVAVTAAPELVDEILDLDEEKNLKKDKQSFKIPTKNFFYRITPSI